MILLIDNYDSFVHNLARYVSELGEQPVVRRHDATTPQEIEMLQPSHIIISPGPCTPGEAGISTDVVRRFGPTIPILGVCLGHQCIGAAYGAGIVRAGRPMHGKASRIPCDRAAISPRVGAHRVRLRPAGPFPARGGHAPRGPAGPRGRGRAAPSRVGAVIIESVLTTMDARGVINFAPMGVEWGEEEIVIKPFLETTTFKNLEASRAAVINLTDDVMVFAQGAIANAQFPAVPAAVVRGVVLEAACSWREVEVRALDATPPRARIATRVVHRGVRREFLGFNRARHAVLEAAILATRTHLLPAEQIRADFARLQVIVDKTAGPREREAMALLTDYVRRAPRPEQPVTP